MGLAIAVTALCAFLCVTYNPRFVPQIAVSGIVFLAITVPSYGPSPQFQVVAVGGSLAIAGIALLRRHERLDSHTNVLLVAYLAYSSVIAALSNSPELAAFRIAIAALMVTLVFLARRASTHASNYFAVMVAIIIVFEVALGFSEAIFGADAFWPRPDGSDRLESRANNLAPWLPGRVLGSTAGPIPYGTIAAIGTITAAWMVLQWRDRRYWMLLIPSTTGLLLSGTRSAAVACLVVVGVWVLTRSTRSRPITVVFGAIGGGVFLLSTDIATLLGFEGFRDSNSFNHRTQIISSVGDLVANQPLSNLLFGNGDDARDLLTNGVITTTTGVPVFDNQLVRELAASGVIGIILLLGCVVVGIRRGNGLSRMLIVFLVMMFMSFDALTWRSVLVFFVLACCGPLASAPRARERLGSGPLAGQTAPMRRRFLATPP